MKFIIIIIALVLAYYLTKIRKRTKEKQNMSNNMILCLECGYHVPKDNKCISSREISECRNRK